MKRHVAPLLAREHGVDFKDFVALEAIEGGANYPRLVCDRLAVAPSGVSRMLDDLVKRDLVTRHLDVHDSRRVRLEITEQGHAVLHAARSTMHTLLDESLAHFPPQQVESFTHTLSRLAELMTQPPSKEETV